MPGVRLNSRIVQQPSAWRHTTPRPSVTARCVPTSSATNKAVEGPVTGVSVAAKADLERTFQQDTLPNLDDGSVNLGMLHQFPLVALYVWYNSG